MLHNFKLNVLRMLLYFLCFYMYAYFFFAEHLMELLKIKRNHRECPNRGNAGEGATGRAAAWAAGGWGFDDMWVQARATRKWRGGGEGVGGSEGGIGSRCECEM